MGYTSKVRIGAAIKILQMFVVDVIFKQETCKVKWLKPENCLEKQISFAPTTIDTNQRYTWQNSPETKWFFNLFSVIILYIFQPSPFPSKISYERLGTPG